MNRCISMNVDAVSADCLPPAQRKKREGGGRGAARVLFVHGNILGFKSAAGQIKKYCEDRDDIDAVHLDLVAPLWLKVLGKSLPFYTGGWDLHSYRHLRLWGVLMARWFRSVLPPDRFDVIHLMTQCNAWAMFEVQRLSPRTKIAINIDGTAAQDVSEFGFSAKARSVFIAAERKMFAAADLMVTRNGWAPGSLRTDYGVPEKDIHVARNSLTVPDARLLHPRAATRNHETPLPRLVWVGNGWRRKGGHILLRVHQERFADKAELHIFGARTPEDHAAKNVIWHGTVPRDELMYQWLPSMDVFVLPSRNDMLPWAALEAASVGLPIVAARVGAISEVVVDGVTGRLHDVDDAQGMGEAIGAMLDDLEGARCMGAAGREHIARNHNPDITYPELIDRLVALADEAAG